MQNERRTLNNVLRTSMLIPSPNIISNSACLYGLDTYNISWKEHNIHIQTINDRRKKARNIVIVTLEVGGAMVMKRIETQFSHILESFTLLF